MKSVRTPLLELAYEEDGPAGGDPVVLVHGWPDDVRTWDRVVPHLTAAGLRVLRPYLRGFGPTRFLDPATPRSGEIAALVHDLLDFAAALELERFGLGGHDWGARAAYGVAALAPGHVRSLVAMSVGYGTNLPDQSLSFEQTRRYWYQWLFGTPRGVELLETGRRDFTRELLRLWSPAWKFDEAEFLATAASFENPDWVAITIHSYRHRWGNAPGDPRYAAVAEALAALPPVGVPTAVLHGREDGATIPETSEGKDRYFTAGYDRRVLEGVGHFIPRERPKAVADVILSTLGSG